jgi:DNA helicase-2/ATP-dependent DNA helicase PcrA
MYVAITRAKRRLYATNVRQRFRFGEYVYAPKSRFITEMQGSKVSIRSTVPMPSGQTAGQNRFGYGAQKTISSGGYGSESQGVQFNKNMVASAPKAPQVSKSNIDYSAFRKDVIVEHKKFGRGYIIATEGSGEDMTASIAFRGLGVKKFSMAVAGQFFTIVKD